MKRNNVLKELWLAHNDLASEDAYSLGIVLKANLYLQFLDISNNNIEVSDQRLEAGSAAKAKREEKKNRDKINVLSF